MAHNAFKAYKSGDFITLAGFNGDSITSRQPNTLRDFAQYLIQKYNEERYTQERRTGATGSAGTRADSDTGAGPDAGARHGLHTGPH
jgi:hypothetical protein